MRILVTGATGNVGSQLLPQLLSHPSVTSVVGVARRLPDDPLPGVEWHALDVAEADLRPVVRGADVVVHLAWLLQPAHDPAEMARVNLRGTQQVVDAVRAEGVPSLVHASSVGAYSPAPQGVRVTEDHPAGGISTSTYSRHKAEVESRLDELTGVRLVRLRPGIVLQAAAASALARYFLGPFVPQTLVRRSLLPVIPDVNGLEVQALHARDMATAYVLAATQDVSGAFNVAADPVLDPALLAEALGARRVPVPRAVVRGLVDVLWRLHVVPVDPGWVDIAVRGPLMDSSRARTVLGWTPTVSALDALREVVDAMGAGVGAATPVLRPRATGPARLAEVARALVPGAGGTA